MAAFDSFVNFVKREMVKRIGTNDGPTSWIADKIVVATGTGLLTTVKTLAELGIVSESNFEYFQDSANDALALKQDKSNLSTDGTFASPDDTHYPSTQAVKIYVDGKVASLLSFRSANYDASSNLFPSTLGSGTGGAILKGNAYFVGVAGSPGGVNLSVGDCLVAEVDDPGQTAANWSVLEGNITYVAEDVANKSTDGTFAANSDTLYPSQKATKTYISAFAQPLHAILTALSGLSNVAGILIQTGAASFVRRTLTGTAGQITVSNGDGVAGNPTLSLVNSGVTAGTYGSASQVPVTTYDSLGRATGVTLATIAFPNTFADNVFRIQDNGDATKQIAFEASAIGTGTTRTITMPNRAVDLGFIPEAFSSNTSLRSGYSVGVNATGISNVMYGTDIGATLTTGIYNTLVGAGAGLTLAAARSYTVGVGASAGISMGDDSVAVGALANMGGTGARTTALGSGSGTYNASTATNWVAVGYLAAYISSGSVSGSNWVSIGANSGGGSIGADWVAVGEHAGFKTTNDSSGRFVAIGFNATRDNYNHGGIQIGYGAGYGTIANHRATADSFNIFIGYNASRDASISSDTTITNSMAIGQAAKVASSNAYVFGAVADTIRMGICMVSPTARFHLPAGAAASNSAPLKFTSGTNLTTAEAGTVEYSGTRFSATLSDATRRRVKLGNEITAVSNITVGASPYTYNNSSVHDEDIIISGGTVSNIQFSRDNSAFYTVGQTSGMFRVSPGDYLVVTYSSTPTMTKVPR